MSLYKKNFQPLPVQAEVFVKVRSLLYWPYVAALAAMLASCGGGGGGGSSGTTPPVPPPVSSPALQFSPQKASASVEAGLSATISINASVLRPQDFSGNVYAFVVDDTGVLLPNARFVASSPTSYTAVLQTAPSLAAGSYRGNFTIKLCRDTGCASQFPGSPMLLPYELTVTPAKPADLSARPETTLGTTMNLGDTPRQQLVLVGGQGLQWTATSNVAWARPVNASGSGPGRFAVEFNAAGLAAGNYVGELAIESSDKQRITLPLTLALMANRFETSGTGFTFNAVNGAPIAPQNVTFSLSNKGAAPFSLASDQAWLSVTPATGTTPGAASFAVDPARGKLASGNHNATVTFTSPAANNLQVPVYLNLTKPTLSASVNTITLGGSTGREFTAAPFRLSLNTRENAWPWTLAGTPAWAGFSAVSGTVNETGTSITVTPNAAAAPIGSTSVVLAPQATVNGDVVSTPLTLTINRDQQKILPSVNGVAFVSTPAWSRLRTSVTVSDNFGAASSWSASSNAAWLSVTRSGNTLTLEADPALVANGATSIATVTLSPATSGVTAPETIRVGFYKGATPPELTKLSVDYHTLVADPIRPLVYVHKGGTTLDIYNVYTAQKTGSVALGAALGDMSVSQDGARLYAYDTANRKVVVLDLDRLTTLPDLPLSDAASSYERLLSVRPNGVELLLTVSGIYRVADGKRISTSGWVGPGLAVSRDGKRVYSQDSGYSPSSASASTLDYSAMGGGTALVSAGVAAARPGENGRDVAVSPDGARVYFANGAPYRCTIFDASLRSIGNLPGGDAYPNNVEVDVHGRAYCGLQGPYTQYDVWLHDANGAFVKGYKFAGYARGLLARQMVVSGDGMMVIALSEDPLMGIIAVGL
nr:quinoprotein amine dehydrogenase [Massilia sp. IC2-476]